ncbi:hypothetical protein CQ047_16470 [Microbacterium sp. MYb72]|nr:hypothetical protein CQ047_16470 [Microbacterium sp. MYb72]
MIRRGEDKTHGRSEIFVDFFVPQMADKTFSRYSDMSSGGYRLRTGETADESSEIFAASPTVRDGR